MRHIRGPGVRGQVPGEVMGSDRRIRRVVFIVEMSSSVSRPFVLVSLSVSTLEPADDACQRGVRRFADGL